jgi:hypothetical protein
MLAVEIDIPYDSSQVEKYGESFTEWTEEDLTEVVRGLTTAMPHNQIATIVSLSSYLLLVLGVSYS